MTPHSTPLGFSDPALHVRGAMTLGSPAPSQVKILTWVADLAIGLSLFSAVFWALWFSPKSPPLLFGTWVAITFLLRWIAIVVLGASLGEGIWNLRRRKNPTNDHTGIFWTGKIESQTPRLMTTGLVIASLLFVQFTFLKHPLWIQADRFEAPTFLPQTQDTHKFAPFFFALGAWPTVYNGKPIFYSIPYEKGPPRQFIGHAIARWDMPSTFVTFEGPKSPLLLLPESRNATQLKRCLTQRLPTPRCVKLRRESLGRHIDEMSVAVSPSWFKLKWLTIPNPALPADEQIQGFWLEAVGQTFTEIRFVIVTEGGTHQAISLHSPTGEAGRPARKLFIESLGSQRVSDRLGYGKMWADQQLKSVDIRALEKLPPQEAMKQLAEVQMMLVSKATVDPASFDTFFHLSGTAALMKKLTLKTPTEDAAAVAKNLIEVAHRYAGDIRPEDPRMVLLRNLWLESRKN